MLKDQKKLTLDLIFRSRGHALWLLTSSNPQKMNFKYVAGFENPRGCNTPPWVGTDQNSLDQNEGGYYNYFFLDTGW